MPKNMYETAWGRVFALLYDTAFVLAEKRGLHKIRFELLRQARGKVVELGAGTGLNVAHYPKDVEELLLTEPDPHMASKLRKRIAGTPVKVSIAQVSADSLPIADSTADTVVCTLVLCTVPDPEKTLQETSRVLRPGGKFLFVEHVRSENPRLARWQDRLNRSWGWYACGCHCNRHTVLTIRNSGLQIAELREDQMLWISPLVRPIVIGVAFKPL